MDADHFVTHGKNKHFQLKYFALKYFNNGLLTPYFFPERKLT